MSLESNPAPGQEAKRILQERARALARRPENPPNPDSLIEVLEFRLAEESYAVETQYVVEVVPLKDLTPLPCTPSFVAGIINVRGHILPVVDMKKFFELPERGLTDLHRVILVRGQGLEFGLLADTTVGVRDLAIESLQPSLPTLSGIRSDYLKGVTSERLVVLDLLRVLTDPRLVVHDEAEF